MYARTVLLAAAVTFGCGGGGGGGGGGTPTPTPTLSATVATPVTVVGGTATVAYALIDSTAGVCSIAVDFSTDGGATWAAAATDAAGGLSTAPSPGAAHTLAWNSLADGVALAAAEPDVRLRITPSGGLAGTTNDFTVDNSANTPPSVGIASFGSAQSGLVPVAYALVDAQSNPCSIIVEYTPDGVSWFTAFAGPGGDGATGLASTPGAGTAHVFVWNSFANGVALGGPSFFVQVRITPSDGETGAATAQSLTVDNSSKSHGGLISSSYPVSGVAGFCGVVATDERALYLGGDTGGGAGDDTSWRIEKRDPVSGALLLAIAENPGPGRDQIETVVIDGATMYVAGAQETALASGNDYLRIEKRSTVDGSLVTSFGTGGVVLIGPLGGLALAGLAVDATHLYVATGDSSSGDAQTRIEKRRLTDGALESGFGTGGVVTQNLNADGDFAAGIGVYGGHLFVGGIVNFSGDMETRLEKRDATTGALLTFVQENAVVGGAEIVAAMTISTSNVFTLRMVETSAGSSQFEWRLAKRSMTDLSLVASATSAALSGDFTKGGLAKVGATIYVTAMDGAGGWGSDTRWRVEKRSAIDLTLDALFGTGGVVLSDPSTGEDVSRQVAVAGGVVYVVGFDEVASPQAWRLEARFE